MADNQMISFAASSSSSSLLVFPNKKYDVFLSFRGEDTRKTFTSHLYDALCQKKIETYIDNRLEKGDEIGPELIKAIEESHISVVIFSENYANSKWCLDEISKIMECRKKIGQIVIPVFYSMDPSHVRNQKGSYEKAFTEYEQDLKHNNKVHKWKTALTEAANLAGWVRSDSQTDNSHGTRAIQSLTLDMRSESKELCLNPTAFSKMFNLKILKLDAYDPNSNKTKMIASEDSVSMPKGLRLLEWWGCPLKSLDSSFCAENLVELDFSYSKLKKLWDGVQSLQYIPPPPPSIDMLEARGCIPLEGVSVSTLDCNWHSKANFSFWNCCKLNQQALNTIMSFSHLKINGAAYIQHLQPNDDKSQRKRNIVSVCLPGSKVPVDRYNYRTATECTISIQLSNLSDLLGLNFCVVFALCEYISCQDVSTKFTCYLITRDGQEDIFTAHSFVPIYVVQEDIRHNSDHVFLWHQQEFSKVLMDKIKERCTDNQGTTTYDPKLTFAMTPGKSIKVKEWGVRPIYSSDLFSFSVPLAVETKTKRKRDSEELLDMKPLSPTKKLKTQYSRKDMSFHQRNM
ncbi:hypothetical protein RIF29_10819 [Crotalaria pallida]|uniref:TIR domain-containing protein n=1 Tax=Crotalaria pallida TaxID=3830 RepID=A0AAN9FT96_CROPI